MIDIVGQSHRGQRRLNEDSFVADNSRGLAIVADGMGGAAAGEVASELVCDTLAKSLGSLPMNKAIALAHRQLSAAARGRPAQSGMGSTVVAARFDGFEFEMGWIGDSRAYLWRDQALHLLTRDHSPVEALKAQGMLSARDARQHPRRHVISRAVGLGDCPPETVPVISGHLGAGEMLLLCSDGLNDSLSGSDIAAELSAGADLKAICQSLIDKALNAGGSDNVTVVLARAGQSGPSPDPRLKAVQVEREGGEIEYFPPFSTDSAD